MLNGTVKDAIPPVAYAIRMSTLGERIRQCREARGYSQEQLGKLLGVTKGAISQWELGGTKNVKLATFLKLIEVLQTSANYLVNGETAADATGRHKALRRP